MSAIDEPKNLEKRWTAEEVRKLPRLERDAILSSAAGLAQAEYGNNSDLTDFEAFGMEDLHGDSSNTQSR